MGYASIVFGAFALLLPSVRIWFDLNLSGNLLGRISLAAAIIGTILGVMSRKTQQAQQGKAGIILCLAGVVFAFPR